MAVELLSRNATLQRHLSDGGGSALDLLPFFAGTGRSTGHWRAPAAYLVRRCGRAARDRLGGARRGASGRTSRGRTEARGRGAAPGQADTVARDRALDTFLAANRRLQRLLDRTRVEELRAAALVPVKSILLLSTLFGLVGIALAHRARVSRAARARRRGSAGRPPGRVRALSGALRRGHAGRRGPAGGPRASALAPEALGPRRRGARPRAQQQRRSAGVRGRAARGGSDRAGARARQAPLVPLRPPQPPRAPGRGQRRGPDLRGLRHDPGTSRPASRCSSAARSSAPCSSPSSARLGEDETQRIQDSVTQAAPVLANLRNLSLAERRASTDSLTGLPNRRGLDDTLKRLVAHANRTHTPVSLVAIDLDHFKDINDTAGHECGDEVLAAFGVMLRANLRGADVASRAGGEEFVVVLPETDRPGAMHVAEYLRRATASLTVPQPRRPHHRQLRRRHAARRGPRHRRSAAARRPRAVCGQATRPQPGRGGVLRRRSATRRSARRVVIFSPPSRRGRTRWRNRY